VLVEPKGTTVLPLYQLSAELAVESLLREALRSIFVIMDVSRRMIEGDAE
jgi:hypothetical protein